MTGWGGGEGAQIAHSGTLPKVQPHLHPLTLTTPTRFKEQRESRRNMGNDSKTVSKFKDCLTLSREERLQLHPKALTATKRLRSGKLSNYTVPRIPVGTPFNILNKLKLCFPEVKDLKRLV